VGVTREIDRTPTLFAAAVEQLRSVVVRPEITFDRIPAPQKIAPYAYALGAEVAVGHDELASGRLILLHDPAGNESWGGTFRFVTYARAEIEAEMAADPMLPTVGWSWLIEELDDYDTEYAAPSGSVTVVRSEPFGQMEDNGSDAQIEVRASWTPLLDQPGASAAHHANAWANLLGAMSGLPPLTPGVIPLQRKRGIR
jgi:hypothetical protein